MSNRSCITRLAAVVGFCLWTMPFSAVADSHLDMEQDLPLWIEDAYTDVGSEFQLISRYERTAEDQDAWLVDPRLRLGFTERTEMTIALPFRPGPDENMNSGDTVVSLFQNLTQEQNILPAFAALLETALPTGKESAGLDSTIKLIATKGISGSGPEAHSSMHANVSWNYNAAPRPEERRHFQLAALGYSQQIGENNQFLTDFLYEESKLSENTARFIELGLRHQFASKQVISLGSDFGLNEEAPDYRLTLALQQRF